MTHLMRLLAVNAGSSSLKLTVLGHDDAVEAKFNALPDHLPTVDAVVHRIVHGGATFHHAVVIDDDIESALREMIPLAPIHQPKSLAALDDVRKLLPEATHIACFDTAFHASIPAAASTYPVPKEWREKYAIRRYGFHGLSHAWAARKAAEILPDAHRIVTCHLGAGASLCAVLGGHSHDTTMGFTPLEGLVMATRSGDVDPGLVMWLAEREPDVGGALENRSGLLGLAGTADMREVLARTDPTAKLALDIYIHRLRKGIAAMAAALGGIDACVFTGGIGENSPVVRQRTVDGLKFLGLALNDDANTSASGNMNVSARDATALTLVVPAREDLQMAAEARPLLGAN